MKVLRDRIRLHKWKLDEARRKLADLEQLHEELTLQITRIDREADAEREAATADDETRYAFANFYQAVMQRRETLSKTLTDLAPELDQTREDVAGAFRDLKKYELALEQRVKRQQAQAKRREQIELDDVAIEGYRRRED